MRLMVSRISRQKQKTGSVLDAPGIAVSDIVGTAIPALQNRCTVLSTGTPAR